MNFLADGTSVRSLRASLLRERLQPFLGCHATLLKCCVTFPKTAAKAPLYLGSSFPLTSDRDTSDPGKLRFEVKKYRTFG